MLFRKRKRPGATTQGHGSGKNTTLLPEYYPIEYDMMLKGAIVNRGRTQIRQFAVMVGGSIRLVTSGDKVDRSTYEALIAAGAIPPPQMPTTADTPPENAIPENRPQGEEGV